jgi:hypothetical protein
VSVYYLPFHLHHAIILRMYESPCAGTSYSSIDALNEIDKWPLAVSFVRALYQEPKLHLTVP